MAEPGLRISYKEHIGTIRFVGPVEGTPGTWLGIEWDDPTRGRHDGFKDGKQYFTCLVPGTGSFLRPSTNIYYGKPFLEALKSKYIEGLHGPQSQEIVVLGSSQGTIQVEAVNLDKIRGKLSKLSSLREISLDGERVANSDPPGTIRETCPNIRGLDLSKSLINSWNTVGAIVKELQYLQRLYLNQNRFRPAPESRGLSGCFDSLMELRLNNTLMTWQDIITVIASMPNLQDLEIGYNCLTDVSFNYDRRCRPNVSVRTVNLNNNQICGWVNVFLALLNFPFLEGVILANNQIKNIPIPDTQQRWPQLKQISLSFNHLQLWRDICALAAWTPSLESLTSVGNPVMTDHSENARPLIIARLAALRILDGAAISGKERRDAELYYLSHIVKHGPVSEDERCQEHPRWQELCSRYGKPDETNSSQVPDTLKSRLSGESAAQSLVYVATTVLPELRLYRTSELVNLNTVEDCLNEDAKVVIRVLPTMTVKNLRFKIRRALSYGPKTNIVISMVMSDGSLVPLDEDHDSHDLSWIGLETGSQLLCCTQ